VGFNNKGGGGGSEKVLGKPNKKETAEKGYTCHHNMVEKRTWYTKEEGSKFTAGDRPEIPETNTLLVETAEGS